MEGVLKLLEFEQLVLFSAIILIGVSVLCHWWIKRKYEGENTEERDMVTTIVDYGFRILLVLWKYAYSSCS